MAFSLIDLLSPHYCCSCGKIGQILCEYCKYDIINDVPVQCLNCVRPVKRYGDTCSECQVYYQQGWAACEHSDAIRKLIADYKFNGARAAGRALAQLLTEALPSLPDDVIITTVPTVRSHVRARGYDHTSIIGRELARLKRLNFADTLRRNHNHRQRGASRSQRINQAKLAFAAIRPLRGGIYLLIDDVCTTGATVNYAAQTLLTAGASQVWVAVVAREPLD